MSRWLWTAELWTPMNITNGVSLPSGGRATDVYWERIPSRLPLPLHGPRSGPLADCLQKRLQLLRPRGVPELPQGLRLDLPDALARDVEGAADLLERVLGAVAHAEAHLEHLLLARRQRLQDAARLLLQVRHEHRVDRREHAAILDEVAQMRILLLADRGLERDG